MGDSGHSAESKKLVPPSLEREALAALRSMRLELEALKRERNDRIAIVGMAFRLPGDVEDPESYWRLLSEKREPIREVPTERFDLTAMFDADPEKAGKTYSRSAGLLERIDEFDADFFGIAPREAAQLDPQQRMFLECAWHALESAAITPSSLRGSMTGVFAGATTWEYASLRDRTLPIDEYDRYSVVGLALNAIAGRVSYALGVHGPSLTIDTACSSSLVAVDRACRSLREGECSIALAGGVNVLVAGESLVLASRSGMLSSCGVVASFSSSADGFVRGEGCGVVVLKRLRDAEASGDRILGVIRGSAVNHDGPTSGLTVPSGQAQQLLLRAAFASAGLSPSAIGYVEAHGTGTRLGDPIEAEALGAVFAGERAHPLAIGSVKTNLGHLEAAAGMAGLIKLLLALEHREIPPQLHFDEPSPLIRWSELPLEVVTRQRPWEPIDGRRIGGVSAFGFSGTNAHVIVEEAPARARPERGEPREAEVLAISAKTEAALARMVTRYRRYLESHPGVRWEDVCHTAAVGRSHFRHRIAVVAANTAAAIELLRAYERGEARAGVVRQGQGESSLQQATAAPLKSGALSAAQLAEAYGAGAEVDWAAWDRDQVRERIRLPGYSFERQRHWFPAASIKKPVAAGMATGHPLLGARLRSAAAAVQYEQTLSLTGELAWLADHRIGGRVLMPATAYAELLLAAADRLPGNGAARVEELMLSRPLELDGECLLQVIVEPVEASLEIRSGSHRVRVYSSAGTGHADQPAWVLHAEGTVRRQEPGPAATAPALEAIRLRCTDVLDAAAFYRTLQARGADFGPRFRQVRTIWRNSDEALGEVLLERLGERLHPASLDACLQVAAALLQPGQSHEDNQLAGYSHAGSQLASDSQTLLPLSLDALTFRSPNIPQQALVYVTRITAPDIGTPSVSASGKAPAALRKLRLQLFAPDHTPITNLITLAFAHTKIQSKEETLSISEKGWIAVENPDADPADVCSEPWVILMDKGTIGAKIASQLSAAAANCTLISINANQVPACVQTGERSFVLREVEVSALALALAHLKTVPTLRVVHLWSLDATLLDPAASSSASREYSLQSHKLGYGAALLLTQLLLQWNVTATLFAVTQAAEPFKTTQVSPVGAALWGFLRVLRGEYPDFSSHGLDLPEDLKIGDVSSVIKALLRRNSEPELVLREDAIFVPRWTPQAPRSFDPKDFAQTELRVSPTGLLEDLQFVASERTIPRTDEIEVEVRAAGINFRDVLTALGMMAGHTSEIGGECAGVVVRAGKDSGLHAGDDVLAFARGSFRPFVTVSARNVAAKPAGISYEEASCLPVSYLTALYALDRLAQLKRGDTVLIHSAAGGLGQAAVQVARLRGARIFATAGTEEKRELLRAQGVSCVMDSRTTAFAREVRENTGGCGVDVVLNSLSGSLLDESLKLVAEGGIFLETGKRGILSDEEARARRPQVRYRAFDLGTEAEKDSNLVPSLLKTLIQAMEKGELKPLPVETFTMANAAQAFRKMSQAKHVGKLCLTRQPSHAFVSRSGTYLITGGLGALGLHTVQWLFERGARSFVLVSRSHHEDAEQVLSQLRTDGAATFIVYGDCADFEVIERALAVVPASAPLRGIVHCAGALRDATVSNQTWDMFVEVAAAKIHGTWNLHFATRTLPLDFFITFSSASATLGAAGQANYAAANAAMDSLALYRKRTGQPALSLNWGPWSDNGMAATRLTERKVQSRGIRPEEAFHAVETLLDSRSAQAMILPSWLAGRLGEHPASAKQANTIEERLDVVHGEAFESKLSTLQRQPAGERRRLLKNVVMTQVNLVLASSANLRYAEDTAFFDLGVDSLMAVELRNALTKTLACELSSTLMFDYPTLGTLLDHLDGIAARNDGEDSKREDVAQLSDAEAEEMLMAELKGGPAR